jgi:hypothetical protein
MNRIFFGVGQIPQDTDLLSIQKNAMIGIGALAESILGQNTVAYGLACTALASGVVTGSAFAVQIGRGFIHAYEETDATAMGNLAADTATSIVKTGINLSSTNLGLANAAPATAGQSINYLIYASFSEVDGSSSVVPYVNSASTPTVPLPPLAVTQNNIRAETVSLGVLGGTAAATGTQATPAAPTGCVPLYVVTVTNGQSQVAGGNISVAPGAPFLQFQLPSLTPAAWAPPRNLHAAVTTAGATATWTADEVSVETALGGKVYVIPNFSAALNLATTGAGGMDTGSAPVSGFVAVYAIYNPISGAYALLGVNATSAVAPEVYGGANMPSGYTASSLISVWPTNSSGQLVPGIQMNRKVLLALTSIFTTTSSVTSLTALTITSIPLNATSFSGEVNIAGNSGAACDFTLAMTSAGIGALLVGFTMASSVANLGYAWTNYPIVRGTRQVYFSMLGLDGTPTSYIACSGYEF